MSDYDKLMASDETGEAVLANITADRNVAATTIVVDDVDNWPDEFIVVTGTLDANGYITPASMCQMVAHLDGGNIEIDNFVPGYTDTGNTDGQVALLKQTTHWADSMVKNARAGHNDDGSHTPETVNPVGSILDFAGSAAPTGWLLCFGQVLNATSNPEYADLFSVIGNTYGGSDQTDFVVPDLRGRVVAGKDNMGGSSADRLTDQSGGVNGDTLGDTGGAETHTLTETEMPSHTHNLAARETSVGGGYRPGAHSGAFGTTVATNAAGSDNPHNNVQPTFILNKIIKY